MTQDSLYNTGSYAANTSKSIGFQPATLADWLATTPGSQRTAQYGYFGPGALLRKDITGAGDTLVQSDFFTNTFGAKVWDSLNSQTRFFNLLRKVAWGPTTGWRIRSGRNASTQGVGETSALPTIDSPDLQTVQVQPSFIVTSMGVSALAQFLATLEGGLGDALAVEQESSEVDHLKNLNQQLLYPAAQRVITDNGAASFDVGTGGGAYIGIGDVFHSTANSGANEATGIFTTVTSISGDTITATATSGGDPDADAVIYTRSRGGMWSIDDVINQDGRTVNGVAISNGPLYGSLTFGARTAGGWNAAGNINGNSGTLRHLATSQIDRVVQNIRQNGFEPDLFVTGVEQEVRLGTILQANQHFMSEGKFQVKMGGEATLPGYETGFEVSTYKKIPLFTDVDTPPVWTLAAGDDGIRGTDFLVLDTRYLEVPVLFTTQYLESRDYIHNNMLGIKAIFLTSANLRCYNFRAQGKVTDLSDGVNLT
ncbi:hypothetical protein LCGC14_0264090 [marine sediment metagenome]|uniref:Major capsid protein n=1 Tax=marine sediment metagenome TaxID=412755 RepID=A0A0F9U0V5_9ZZZZ